jgi:outer membrane protein assembly factor BamB
VALCALSLVACGTSSPARTHLAAGSATPAMTRSAIPSTSPTPAGPPPVFQGRLLIADRGNNRLLLVNADKQLLWTFPNAHAPAPPTGFYFPDDAFFIHHGTGIISNQEGNDTVVEIGFPSGKPLWAYGHPHVASSASGYLHEPDDAYLLKDGRVVVADANNCRVVIITGEQQSGQIGKPGSCVHAPPSSLGYPNGDTPLRDGNILISEVHGSWISEYTLAGRLVWTVQLPQISYVSDPQQIGPDLYLVADYARPGGLFEFTRAGRIVWSYRPTSGPGMLDHPSLAEVLPGGLICTNDDYRDRVVIIDPHTNQIVWQYGATDHPGTQPGYLNTPDGFDLLAPDNTTPTHPFTG